MPVNFQQIQSQIKEMGKQAPERERALEEKVERARARLLAYANRLDELRGLVKAAQSYYSALRCAEPPDERFAEPLTLHRPLPPSPAPRVLIAADGSQINPDRHAQVQFGVINVGAFRMAPGQAPREMIQSDLLTFEQLEDDNRPIGEEVVALMRDLAERKSLAELVKAEVETEAEADVLTLTDGPLELFREPKEQKRFQQLFGEYLEALERLAGCGAVTAGYVDRPRGDLVVRLLELTELQEQGDLEHAGKRRLLHPVIDLALFSRLLEPGERSAIFQIRSSQAARFTGVFALHFFYLNVGRPGHPYLARVELPEWVACNPVAVDTLHAALVAQCKQMGARPYPYALQRAHEVAVVSLDEKRQLEDMIALELRRQGAGIEGTSHKQANKEILGGKTRYS